MSKPSYCELQYFTIWYTCIFIRKAAETYEGVRVMENIKTLFTAIIDISVTTQPNSSMLRVITKRAMPSL